MKKTLVKALAVVTSAALITGTGATYYAKADKSEEDELGSKLLSFVEKKDYESELFQDETVYVINNNNGETEKTIVVDKLKDNADGTETVTGKELNSETPVKVNVTYNLDGNDVPAGELAGKSGHIRIIYDYTNTQYETVMINGSEEKIYVPFMAVTGTILNKDVFSNIKIEGGKLIDDGTRQAVIGVALPGLTESLGAESVLSDKVVIPEKLVIEADVQNFELGTVYTLVTNYNFDEFSVDEDGIKSTLTTAIDAAKDGFTQLTDGSAQLYEGLVSAKDGSAALTDGAAAAYEGSKQLAEGTAQLALGLEALSANSAALNGGAEQVFESILANAEKGLRDAGIEVPELTVENYSDVLEAVIAQLRNIDPEAVAEEKVRAAAESNRQMIEAQVAAAVQAQTGASDDMMASEQMKAVVAQKTDEQIELLIAQNLASDEVKAQIAQGKAQAEAGAASIANVKKSLDDYNTFYQGIKKYTAGVDAAKGGAEQLNAGAGALTDGLEQLYTGEQQLDEGLAQLRDGAKALNEGLNMINDELVVKLETLVNGELADLTDRLKALKQVSSDYKCIDTLGEAEDGSVKFIYKNEAIRK